MTDTADTRLIVRLQKLMAMANHAGSNENEAAVAAEMIQKLLTEHNLDMAQVMGASAKQDARERATHEKSAMYEYQTTLMRTLAANNFCMYWRDDTWRRDPRGRRLFHRDGELLRGRRVKVHVLVGRTVNVTATRITYDYLVEAIDRLLPYQGMDKRGRDALLWLAGCTERLVERLAQRRREAEMASARAAAADKVRRQHPASAGTGRDLVVLADVYGSEEDLNNDHRYGYEPGTTARERRDREARAAAAEARDAERVRDMLAADPSLDPRVAELMARGWDRAGAEEYYGIRKPTPTEETEAQRRKREAREERGSERNHRRWRKDRERRNDPAFRAGAQTGNDIGLDQQVSQHDRKPIGRA